MVASCYLSKITPHFCCCWLLVSGGVDRFPTAIARAAVAKTTAKTPAITKATATATTTATTTIAATATATTTATTSD